MTYDLVTGTVKASAAVQIRKAVTLYFLYSEWRDKSGDSSSVVEIQMAVTAYFLIKQLGLLHIGSDYSSALLQRLGYSTG